MSAVDAETTTVSRRRRSSSSPAGPPPPGRTRRRFDGTPYALIAPALAVLAAILAFPLYLLVTLAFQRKNVGDLYAGRTVWVGLRNFSTTLGDDEFWRVLLRTVIFTAVNVGLTVVLGLLIALLMQRLGPRFRTLLILTLVAVWATPWLVSVVIWKWLTDFQYGVLNYALDKLPFVSFAGHNWFEDPIQGLGVVTAVVVWGAIPFAAITLYAGLTQVPRELTEAAQIDGAGAWQTFRNVTLPIIKPVLTVVVSLEIIWDFQLFNQLWVMLEGRPGPDYQLIATYLFAKSFGISQYGLGAAIAVLMVLMTLALTSFYIRQIMRSGEIR